MKGERGGGGGGGGALVCRENFEVAAEKTSAVVAVEYRGEVWRAVPCSPSQTENREESFLWHVPEDKACQQPHASYQKTHQRRVFENHLQGLEGNLLAKCHHRANPRG